MAKTALTLNREIWRTYRPGAWKDAADTSYTTSRWERAWQVAREAARQLREEFAPTRVVVFGSLAHRAWFTPWSDIDLAAWDIPPEAFYRAVALVTGLSSEFEVDLVAPEACSPALRRVIEQEGIEL